MEAAAKPIGSRDLNQIIVALEPEIISVQRLEKLIEKGRRRSGKGKGNLIGSTNC